MNYSVTKEKIVVDNRAFDAKAVLFSGQAFRVKTLAENKWLLSAGERAAIIEKGRETTDIICEDTQYFVDYFDLRTDYGEFLNSVTDEFALCAIKACPPLKIMKQERFETIVDFIMSANNKISRFSVTLDKIARKYGKKKNFCGEEYFTFPKPEDLANADLSALRAFGCGYRDKYIVDTAKKIADGFDLDVIPTLCTVDANKYLCRLSGVGEKVADCILLFAFQKYDAFPVDTWIEKVYRESYGGVETDRKKIRRFFVERFGDKAGVVQQYLFFNAREKADKIAKQKEKD